MMRSMMISYMPVVSAETQKIIDGIKYIMTSHPSTIHEPVTGCVVMNDDQWHTYKKYIARLAKERKTSKKMSVSSRKVRNMRDASFVPIDGSGRIIRICDSTFDISKFVTMEEISTDPVYKSNVDKCLRGETSKFDGYFWTRYVVV